MNLVSAARTALIALTCCSALLATGCGGGATPAPGVTAAPAPTPTPQPMPAPAPQPQSGPSGQQNSAEMLSNGNFALGLNAWATGDATLVPSGVRGTGQALNIVGWATQRLVSNPMVAGQSYTLLVMARTAQAGSAAQVAVRFLRPDGVEVVRNFQTPVTATTLQLHRIDFTAPPYAAMGEVALNAAGGTLHVDEVSLRPRAAIVQTEPVASQADSHVPPGYVLAFNDEFSGSTLDRAKWFTRYIYGSGTTDRLNDEKQRYRDNDNHSVAGGVLSLTARKVSSSEPDGINYESGMVRSDWTTRYGYFEARVKMPRGIGMWPAFWLVADVSESGALSWPPEIDIFEFVNNGVEDRANMLHSGVVPVEGATSVLSYVHPDFNTQWTFYSAPFNFDEGWHTVGAEWTPTSVTMYLDGVKIYTRSYLWNYTDGTLAGPAHILLNLAVGGQWAGRHGIDDALLPQSLQVDWVRAYKKLP